MISPRLRGDKTRLIDNLAFYFCMIQHPDERPKEPTPDQAERFRTVVERIMNMTVSDGTLYAEQEGDDIGFTIEETRISPLVELSDDGEDTDPITIVFYYDFILFGKGKFEKHVTVEELELKEKREADSGVLGPISRNRPPTDEPQILDATNEEHATRIVVEKLNGLVDLGRVNPLELDTGMTKAEEILYNLE